MKENPARREKGLLIMTEKLNSMSCIAFSEQLASKAPVPGGGGAAALIGALAAALGAMATNLTVGKKKFLCYEEDHQRILSETERLRTRFLDLMEEDAALFEPLSRVYSMDRSDPAFAGTLRQATMDAVRAPFEMMRCACELVALLEELRGKCSVLLLSDVGCAAVAAYAALEAASMNVFVNTRTLPEDPEASEIGRQASDMLACWLPRARALSDDVMAVLRTTK